jgi:hypothetical protein
VPCNGEIGIRVVGLPRVAGQTDFPRNGGALNALIHVSAKKIQNKRNTYIQMFPKQIHLLFKRMDDLVRVFLGVGMVMPFVARDAISSMASVAVARATCFF